MCDATNLHDSSILSISFWFSVSFCRCDGMISRFMIFIHRKNVRNWCVSKTTLKHNGNVAKKKRKKHQVKLLASVKFRLFFSSHSKWMRQWDKEQERVYQLRFDISVLHYRYEAHNHKSSMYLTSPIIITSCTRYFSFYMYRSESREITRKPRSHVPLVMGASLVRLTVIIIMKKFECFREAISCRGMIYWNGWIFCLVWTVERCGLFISR